jgi:hypothetical protein
LLLTLASAVILGFVSRGTHKNILLIQTRDSTNLEDQVVVFISPRNRVAQLHPQALGSLFLASYDSQGTVRIEARLILRLAFYRQSVHLGAKTHETHDQQFFD